ncbi:uncharacterized protein EDB91DRAFT_1088556 [Suillus paluster]|uniref:uncharacterized protein n=1 Tax=Suillus paluster TaxID=48578 RepID=UPI001B85F742|nr:uncharacterized protein EDB91DRAFT_1088556 [Suillus paluster]KAG1721126.1 hypothetical protein EDB91DRAFT_1088556 [Suillus paluster]
MTRTLINFSSPSHPLQLNFFPSPDIHIAVLSYHSFRPPSNPSLILRVPCRLLHHVVIPGDMDYQSTRLEDPNWSLICGPSHASPKLSVEIRASLEFGGMLGNGELIGQLEMSWVEPLGHGDEPLELSFPLVYGVHPSLTLKAALVNVGGNNDGELLTSIIDCEIARETDAGHTRFAAHVTSKPVSDLNDAVEHVALVLERWPVGHPDQPRVRTLSRGHPDYPSSLYHLLKALIWRYSKEPAAIDLRESAQISLELLPICPEGTYLRTIVAGASAVSLCPEGHPDRGVYLNNLAVSLRYYRFRHQDKSDDLDEAVSLYEEALCLSPVGHKSRDLQWGALLDRFKQRGEVEYINTATSLRHEALTLRPPGHQERDTTLS